LVKAGGLVLLEPFLLYSPVLTAGYLVADPEPLFPLVFLLYGLGFLDPLPLATTGFLRTGVNAPPLCSYSILLSVASSSSYSSLALVFSLTSLAVWLSSSFLQSSISFSCCSITAPVVFFSRSSSLCRSSSCRLTCSTSACDWEPWT
jgi:hypothetical protein